MTANDIDEEPTLFFLRVPVDEPAIMELGKLDVHEKRLQATSLPTRETRTSTRNHSAYFDNTTMFRMARVQVGSDDQILPIYNVPTTRHTLRMGILRKRAKRPRASKAMSRKKPSKVVFVELNEFTKRPVNVQLVAVTNATTVAEFSQPKSISQLTNGKFFRDHRSKERHWPLGNNSMSVGSNQNQHRAEQTSAEFAAGYPIWKEASAMKEAVGTFVETDYKKESSLKAVIRTYGNLYPNETSVESTASQSLLPLKHWTNTSSWSPLYQDDVKVTHEDKLPQHRAAATQCNSLECQIARELNSHIADGIETNPCEDFQLHVCGGQQARSRGLFMQMQDEALNSLKKLLNTPVVPETGHTATQKAISLFQACMRFSKGALAQELPSIKHFLESVGLNLTGRQEQVAKDTTDNPVLPMLRLSLQYAFHTFVAFRIDGINVINGKKIVRVVVGRSDQAWLKERAMLSEQEKKDYYAGVLLVYEAQPLRPEIVMLIPDIANFESEAFKKLADQRRIPRRYRRSSFIRMEDLATYAHWYGQPDEWHAQLQQLSLLAYGANDSAHASPAALELLKLITQPESWPKGHQLICWSLIRQIIGFGRNPLLAMLPESELTSHCIRKVSDVMEPAIQGLLLFKQFLPEVQNQVETMVSVFLETIAKRLKERINASRHQDGLAWREALHRLSTVELVIGFPGHIRAESDLEAMYGSFPKSKRIFWETWIRYANIVQGRALERVGQPDVNFEAAGTKAAYSPCINKLVIPAGVGRPPFLISSGPPSYNYAAIGAMISHALFRGDCSPEARGIDTTESDCKNWWTPTAQYYYFQRIQCRATESHSLGEDYALGPHLNVDSGLLHALAATAASYEAFRSLPSSQRDHVLPTLNYTAEQLFFVVNCALRCFDDKTKPGGLAYDDNALCEDGASSSPWLSDCNDIAKRMQEFAAAFHCPVGSKMNPRDRCAT